MRHLLLLLLPTVTLANIIIKLQGTIHSDVVSSVANYKGFNERLMIERDKSLFGIQNDRLSLAIEKINGKKPDAVYTTKATPFGNIHERYRWKEVNVQIQPQLNDVYISFKSDTAKLSKTRYENSNSRPKNTLINENGYLNNTVYSFWTQAAQVIAGDVTINFNYNIEDKLIEFKRVLALGKNQKFTEKNYYETNATIILEPGQKVTAELEALKRTIKIEIPYDVFLSGDVIAQYNQMHKDKYFFKFDINDLLKANNITTTGRLQQTLIYEHLSDAELHIRDSADVVLKSIPAQTKINTKGLKKATNKHHDKAEGVPMKKKNTSFDIPENLAFEIIDDHNDEESEENEKPTLTENQITNS